MCRSRMGTLNSFNADGARVARLGSATGFGARLVQARLHEIPGARPSLSSTVVASSCRWLGVASLDFNCEASSPT